MIKAIDRYGQGRMFHIGTFRADYNPSDNRMALLGPNHHTFALAHYVGGNRWRVQFAVGGRLRGNHVLFALDLWDLAGQMERQLVARAVHSSVTRGLLDRAALEEEGPTTLFVVRKRGAANAPWMVVHGWSETENFQHYPLKSHEVRRVFFGLPMLEERKLSDVAVTEVPVKPKPAPVSSFTGLDQKSDAARRFKGRVLEAQNLFECIDPAEDFLGAVLYGQGVKPSEAALAFRWICDVVRDAFGDRSDFGGFVEFVQTRLSCTVGKDGRILGSDEPTTGEDLVVPLREFIAMPDPS